MAGEAQGPKQLQPIPPLVTHVGAAFGPIDLKEMIKPADAASGAVRFSAMLTDGGSLPNGVICTGNGLIAGIAADGTEGTYDLAIGAEHDNGGLLMVGAKLTIKESLALDDPSLFNLAKSEVWKALNDNLPVPDLTELLNRPITDAEIYYLLERYGVLTIWDVYNLEQPATKQLLSLEGTNKHYQIYDRGSCLVAAPKELYSHERTLADALDVSRTLAREVYRRGWTIEFAGFNKMVRAAWVELQNLGEKHGKKIEVLHYTPSHEDVRAYTLQMSTIAPAPGVVR